MAERKINIREVGDVEGGVTSRPRTTTRVPAFTEKQLYKGLGRKRTREVEELFEPWRPPAPDKP